MPCQVFVSYSHKDQVWLNELLEFLRPICDGLGCKLWLDKQEIEPGEQWDLEIRKALNSSQIAVMLVSQPLLASTYIRDVELPLLLDLRRKQQVGLFWVPIGTSTYDKTGLKDLQAAVGDPKDPLEGLSAAQRNRLWKELCDKVEAYVRRVGPAGPSVVASAGKVYLSVPAPEEELRLATARLEKELRDFGYDVVPDKPLAERWKDAEPEIRAALTDANLLIGLLGSEYPRLAQGYNKRPGATLLELENEIAAELSIRRLLWIPQSFKREDTVSTFAETVRTYSEPGRLKPGYEWRDSHIEDFIEDIHAQLKLSRQRLPASGGSAQTLYLVCGESDHPANSSDGGRKVSKIKLHVEDQNRKDQTYSVLLPPFSVASLDDLLEAEAFLLYWGDGDAKEYFWPNLQVFNKAVGKRAAASKPFRTKILYLTDPRVQYKSECCPKNTFSVIEQYGDEAFHPNELDKYLWP